MAEDSNHAHAGTWHCEGCGEAFEVESKLDPLTHALTCGDTGGSQLDRPEGYERRRERLREVQ